MMSRDESQQFWPLGACRAQLAQDWSSGGEEEEEEDGGEAGVSDREWGPGGHSDLSD